jgi:hypothetical protein
MALNLSAIESVIKDHFSQSYCLSLKPSSLFYLMGGPGRRAYLKAKRRWFRDFYEETSQMRGLKNG